MAGPTNFNLTDAVTRQIWDTQLMVGVQKRCAIINSDMGLIGDKDTNLIQRKRALFEEGGSQATITLVRDLRQEPTYGNQEIRNREEGLRTPTFRWEINQTRHAVAINGRITPQRVPWKVWETTQNQLIRYWAPVLEAGLLLHGAGVTTNVATAAEWYHNATNLGITMANAPRAPDAAHIFRVHDHASDDLVALDPSAIIDVPTVNRLVATAKMLPYPIRPATINGRELYVLFVHPYQVYSLKQNSRWLAYMRDTLKGGAWADSPLWDGALGISDGVLWVESPYIPPGVDGSGLRVANVRRAVFCGAQSFVVGWGKDHEDETDFISETEKWDYGNNKGLAMSIIAGFRSTFFEVDEQGTTEDYGKIVVPSYAREFYTSAAA